jgi:cation transport protein ChaC
MMQSWQAVGYEPIDQLAQTIYNREGPSGPNRVRLSELMSQDYVYKLAESVRKLYPNVKDDYLFELEVSHVLLLVGWQSVTDT